jgi:hypothetical protein
MNFPRHFALLMFEPMLKHNALEHTGNGGAPDFWG